MDDHKGVMDEVHGEDCERLRVTKTNHDWQNLIIHWVNWNHEANDCNNCAMYEFGSQSLTLHFMHGLLYATGHLLLQKLTVLW